MWQFFVPGVTPVKTLNSINLHSKTLTLYYKKHVCTRVCTSVHSVCTLCAHVCTSSEIFRKIGTKNREKWPFYTMCIFRLKLMFSSVNLITYTVFYTMWKTLFLTRKISRFHPENCNFDQKIPIFVIFDQNFRKFPEIFRKIRKTFCNICKTRENIFYFYLKSIVLLREFACAHGVHSVYTVCAHGDKLCHTRRAHGRHPRFSVNDVCAHYYNYTV